MCIESITHSAIIIIETWCKCTTDKPHQSSTKTAFAELEFEI